MHSFHAHLRAIAYARKLYCTLRDKRDGSPRRTRKAVLLPRYTAPCTFRSTRRKGLRVAGLYPRRSDRKHIRLVIAVAYMSMLATHPISVPCPFDSLSTVAQSASYLLHLAIVLSPNEKQFHGPS